MLGDQDAQATVAVKDLKVARPFYEEILGLRPLPSDQESVQAFQAGKSLVLVYESQFAGTNKATVLTWALGETFDAAVEMLRDRAWCSRSTTCRGWAMTATCTWPAACGWCGSRTRTGTC